MKKFPKNIELERFIKYCVVGINGIGINVLVLYILTSTLGLFYLLSSLVAHEVSIIINCLFNDKWTFKNVGEKRSFVDRLVRYNLAKLTGIFLSIILMYMYTELFSVNYLISNVLAIVTGVGWGFFTSMRFVWK